MAKMRIYEIARSMQQQNKNIKSADLVSFLNANGYEVKSAQSSIEGSAIPFLLMSFEKGVIPFEGSDAKAGSKKANADAPKPVKEEKPEAPNGRHCPFPRLPMAFQLVSPLTILCFWALGKASTNQRTGIRPGQMFMWTIVEFVR